MYLALGGRAGEEYYEAMDTVSMASYCLQRKFSPSFMTEETFALPYRVFLDIAI